MCFDSPSTLDQLLKGDVSTSIFNSVEIRAGRCVVRRAEIEMEREREKGKKEEGACICMGGVLSDKGILGEGDNGRGQ